MKKIRSYTLLPILLFIVLLGSCAKEKEETRDYMEIKGYVLSKEMNNGLLIVPRIEESELEKVISSDMDAEEIVYENNGAYYYVSKDAFESVNVGDQVYMKYIQGNTDDAQPPHIQVEVLKFTKQ